MNNETYMLWLSSLTHKLGSQRLNNLLEIFETAENIFKAQHNQLKEFISQACLNILIQSRNYYKIEELYKELEDKNIKYFSQDHLNYPYLLKRIPDPPIGLFCIGELPDDTNPKIAIIGARRCSEYGRVISAQIAESLAKDGLVIVSGMARGIDSMAHKGALKSGGITIAVLGSGCDICYPVENNRLKEEIEKTGCVISEYAPSVIPHRGFFPARNRIISGISNVLIVVEAAKKSGTLITVGQAAEQGRDVFAVPGNINSELSYGTNALIRDGATPLLEYTDILNALGIEIKTEKQIQKKLTPQEKQLYSVINHEPIGIDALIEYTKQDVGNIYSNLMSLQYNGFIKELPGSRYIRRH